MAKKSYVKTLGIAVDNGAKIGANHLYQTYEFDEIAAGGLWNNYAISELMKSYNLGPGATPTLLILERALSRNSVAGLISVDSSKEIAVLTGLKAIQAFDASQSIY